MGTWYNLSKNLKEGCASMETGWRRLWPISKPGYSYWKVMGSPRGTRDLRWRPLANNLLQWKPQNLWLKFQPHLQRTGNDQRKGR